MVLTLFYKYIKFGYLDTEVFDFVRFSLDQDLITTYVYFTPKQISSETRRKEKNFLKYLKVNFIRVKWFNFLN